MADGTVRVLSEELANKIAAGEVVERPASIIKELLENSIDAGANSITISCVNGGKRLIEITDDGTGMGKDDALLAFERHATSKLHNVGDLFNIATLGFRGEALPSIAAVSKVELTTSTGGAGEGVRVSIDGGVIREVREAAHPRGTSFSVRNLFFNTPARRKFLKTAHTELGHISNIAIREALSMPHIALSLTHNGRDILRTPSQVDLLPRIRDLFGKEIIGHLVPAKKRRAGMEVDGWITGPGFHRAGRDSLYLYINRRYVRDRVMVRSVMDAYRAYLPRERNPMVFLFLTVDPKEIDVNVHPSKTEVRFARRETVYDLILESVREAIRPGNGKGASTGQDVHPPEQAPYTNAEAGRLARKALFDPCSRQESYHNRDFPQRAGPSQPPAPDHFQRSVHPAPAIPQSMNETWGPTSPEPELMDASRIGLTGFRPLGQIDNTYIVLEGRQGMILMDQHTAHERILYERILSQKKGKGLEVQELLFPVTMELASDEMILLESAFEQMRGLGFDMEPFGGNGILIRSVPTVLAGKEIKSLVRDIIDRLKATGKGASLEDMAGDLIAVTACHAAVRAGQALKPQEMESLIMELQETDRPFTCPHGRPISLFYEMRKIKRYFFRG